MSTTPNSPLTEEHLAQINAGLRALQTLETQITLAKQAGIDVTHYEQQMREQKQKLLALKNTYFPGSY